MKKRRYHADIPELPVFLDEDVEQRAGLLDAFIETRRRVGKFLRSRKNRHLVAQHRIVSARRMELRQDMQEETRDLAERKTLVQLVGMADKNGFEKEAVVHAYLILTDMFKDIMKDFPGLKGALRAGSYLTSSLELGEIADTTRAEIPRFVEDIKLHLKPQAHGFFDAVSEMLVTQADNLQLLVMHDPLREKHVIKAAVAGNVFEGELAPEGIAAQESCVEAIRREFDRTAAEEENLELRLMHALDYALKPIRGFLEKDQDLTPAQLPAFLLSVVQVAKYSEMFIRKPWQRDPVAAAVEFQSESLRFHESLAICKEFWFIALSWILGQSGALTESGGFKEWTRSLLLEVVLHPARINRLPVPQEAQKTRSALAKRIAPFFKGCEDVLRNIMSKSADDEAVSDTAFLCVQSVCLTGKWVKEDKSDCDLSEKERRTIEYFWRSHVGPQSEAILLRMAEQSERTKKKGWTSVLGELLERDDDFDIEDLEIEEPPLPENWHYVMNPGRLDTAVEKVVFSCDEDPGVTIENFLRARKIKPTVKPISIVTALEHFRDMPEMLRAVMPHEQVENESWHKIKRGKLRILARLEDDGRLLFNIYPRKDWVRRE